MPGYLSTIRVGDKNSSISLEIYNGRLFIVSTWETRTGETKANWVFRQDRVDGENVPGNAMPLRIPLGNSAAEARKILKQLIESIPGANKAQADPVPAKHDDDIPIPF